MQVSNKNKIRVLRQLDALTSNHKCALSDTLLSQIKQDDFEAANKILQYGFDARQVVMNYDHIKALKNFGFNDFKIDENGWIPHPEWLNVEYVEFLGWSNSFEIGQGPNGLWTYGVNASNNTSGFGCGLNEYIEPLTKDAAVKEAITGIVKWHERQISQDYKEEAAKNTSRKVLAIIKKYQQPKQAVLF